MRRPSPRWRGKPPNHYEKRYPLTHIAVFDLYPPATDHSHRTPVGEPLLGRHSDQLVYPLPEDCVVIFDDQM